MKAYPNVKINLGLSILRKRPDGYHDIETLFVPYHGLRDELEILPCDGSGDRIVLEGGSWDPQSDLTLKAVKLLRRDFGFPPVEIRLVKHAPAGAGLGGGSSDASFALRMVQKAGKVFIYDLNAVSTLLEPETVVWDSDDAVLGTDSVYNNVTIKYSPYFRQKLLDGSVDKGTVKEDTLSPTYSVNVDLGGENVPGFKITFTDSGTGIVKGEQAKYFKVDKIFSGSDDAGVAWTFKNLETGNKWVDRLNPPTSVIGSYMVCAAKDKPYIAYTSKSRGEKYYLKVLLNMMVDVR